MCDLWSSVVYIEGCRAAPKKDLVHTMSLRRHVSAANTGRQRVTLRSIYEDFGLVMLAWSLSHRLDPLEKSSHHHQIFSHGQCKDHQLPTTQTLPNHKDLTRHLGMSTATEWLFCVRVGLCKELPAREVVSGTEQSRLRNVAKAPIIFGKAPVQHDFSSNIPKESTVAQMILAREKRESY